MINTSVRINTWVVLINDGNMEDSRKQLNSCGLLSSIRLSINRSVHSHIYQVPSTNHPLILSFIHSSIYHSFIHFSIYLSLHSSTLTVWYMYLCILTYNCLFDLLCDIHYTDIDISVVSFVNERNYLFWFRRKNGFYEEKVRTISCPLHSSISSIHPFVNLPFTNTYIHLFICLFISIYIHSSIHPSK